MKNIKIIILSAILFSSMAGCKKEPYEVDYNLDPNAPPVDLYVANATRSQINQLAVGLQSAWRNGILDFIRITGTVGREVIYSASTDNRYFTELLGTNTAALGGANDPSGIFNTYYSSYSQTRRRAELFITASKNTNSVNAAEKSAIDGFSKTIQAYVTLNLLNMQGKNGIRETFTELLVPGDQLKPGTFGTYTSGLVVCKKYADDGLAALNAAGSAAFPFKVNSGFSAFSTVAEFKKFNRAIAARIAMYQSDWAGMNTALGLSYLDLTGNLKNGPTFIFSTAANDITNGMYHVPNSTGAPFVVFAEVTTDAEAGDTRMFGSAAKIGLRTTPRQSGPFASAYETRMYANNQSPFSVIRNEELLLMYAEVKAQTASFPQAKAALDLVRAGAGLGPYSGALTQAALVDEVLKQRRYSLFWEGHRWFDMRRYNRLAQVQPQGNISGNTYVVFEAMARPDAEVQWDKLNP